MTQFVTQEVAWALANADAVVLGNRIKLARTAAGLTQGDIAAPADITPAYVSRIEDGQRRPSAPVFASFATTMSMTPEALVGLAPTPVPAEDVAVLLDRVLRQLDSMPMGKPRQALETRMLRRTGELFEDLLTSG